MRFFFSSFNKWRSFYSLNHMGEKVSGLGLRGSRSKWKNEDLFLRIALNLPDSEPQFILVKKRCPNLPRVLIIQYKQ